MSVVIRVFDCFGDILTQTIQRCDLVCSKNNIFLIAKNCLDMTKIGSQL